MANHDGSDSFTMIAMALRGAALASASGRKTCIRFTQAAVSSGSQAMPYSILLCPRHSSSNPIAWSFDVVDRPIPEVMLSKLTKPTWLRRRQTLRNFFGMIEHGKIELKNTPAQTTYQSQRTVGYRVGRDSQTAFALRCLFRPARDSSRKTDGKKLPPPQRAPTCTAVVLQPVSPPGSSLTCGSISSRRSRRSVPKMRIFCLVLALRNGDTSPNARPNHAGALTTNVLWQRST